MEETDGWKGRKMSEGQTDMSERQTCEVCDKQIGGTGEKQTSGAERVIDQEFAVLQNKMQKHQTEVNLWSEGWQAERWEHCF